MERNRDRHGPIFTVKLGALKRCAFIAEPEAAWKVLSGDPVDLPDGPDEPDLPARPRRAVAVPARRRGAQAPSPPDGARRSIRRRSAATRGLIEEITAREIASWPVEQPFPLQEPMRRITTESIVRIVVGVCTPDRDAEIRRLVREMLEIAENPFALMPQFQREIGGRSPFGKVMEVTRQIDRILLDEIGLRRSSARRRAWHGRALDAGRRADPRAGLHVRPGDPRRDPDAADRRPRDDRERPRLGLRAAAPPSGRPGPRCWPSSAPTTTTTSTRSSARRSGSARSCRSRRDG